MVLVALFYNGKITLKKLTNQQKKEDLYLNIKPKLPMYILLGENTDKKTKPNAIT